MLEIYMDYSPTAPISVEVCPCFYHKVKKFKF